MQVRTSGSVSAPMSVVNRNLVQQQMAAELRQIPGLIEEFSALREYLKVKNIGDDVRIKDFSVQLSTDLANARTRLFPISQNKADLVQLQQLEAVEKALRGIPSGYTKKDLMELLEIILSTRGKEIPSTRNIEALMDVAEFI